MKKTFLLAIALFSFIVSTTSATNIPSGTVSGSWTLSGSPYNIQGSIQIPNDSTLTIQPGVVVNFLGTYKLNVQGRLLAIGTAADSITFTAADTTNGWRGIRFDNTPITNDTSRIVFCKLQYGKITGTAPNNNGGGMYFKNFSKVIISKCTISYCTATGSGGGIYCLGSSPLIINNIITKNRATTSACSGGGGILCDASNPIISGNIISYNWASDAFGSGGGGINCSTCSPIITDNIISNNSGSGICCGSNGINPSAIINNNTIINNRAYIGGGICCEDYCSPTIKNNIISNNTASDGGGIYCISNSSIINNNSISNNTATGNGGGIYYKQNSNATLYNNTFANNTAANGGVIFCNETSSPIFRNCILWGNTASASGAQVYLNDEASDPGFYYCDIQGSSAAFELNGNMYIGTYQNNINSDPKFISPSGGSGSSFNGLSANWALQSSSPCINTGDPNGTYPATDITGNPRVNVCRIDMGAYEYQAGIPFKVALNISQPILCNGTATGEITAVVSGGALPYTFQWSNGQTTATISGLVAGNYTVTISESSFGCSLAENIVLPQPPATSITAGTDTSIICGSSGQLNVKPKWVSVSNFPGTGFTNSIFFITAGTGYVVGTDSAGAGSIFKTVDGGDSWTKQNTGTTNSLYSVYFTNADTGWAIGSLGIILKTTNGGSDWVQQSTGTTNYLYSEFFTNSDTGYVVGSSGIILKTTNGGTSWITQISNISYDLNSLYFIQADTGYVVGNSGNVLKTTNGGINWIAQNTGISSLQLHSVYFSDNNIGFVAGYDNSYGMASIIKTINGGLNWSVQHVNAHQINSMFFINADTAYAVSDNGGFGMCNIFQTIDGGNNWDIQSSWANQSLNSVFFATANAGFLVGNSGTLLKLTIPVSYSWTPISGLNNSNIANPTISTNVTTNYIVTAISINGCIAKDTVTVHISPFIVNAGLNKTIICGGGAQFDSIVTNLDTSNYTGTYIYNWSPITGLNYDTIQNPVASVTSNTIYYVTVTTTNGCNAADSISVDVSPLTITGTGGTMICGDSTTTLNTITNYTGTDALTYSWLPITGLDSSNVVNPIAIADSNQTYTVTVTTLNGCVATDDVSISIIPMNAPEICIVGVDSLNKNRIVWNKPVSLTIDSFYIYRETNITNLYQKIGAVSYDSLAIFSDINSFPDVQSNKYKISIKDDCGLESDTSAPHKTMHLSINQGIGTTYNLLWNDYLGFTVTTYNVYRGTDPNNLQLIGTSSGSNTAYSDLTPPAGSVYYQVEVIGPNNCNPSKSFNSSRSNISSNNPYGITESHNALDLISIYPNPANDNIEISVSEISQVEIMNTEGQILKSFKMNADHASIDVTAFAAGVYFVKAINDKGFVVRKFIKE